MKEGHGAMEPELVCHESGWLEVGWKGGLLVFNIEEVLKAYRRGETVLRNRARAAVQKNLPEQTLSGEISDEMGTPIR